MEINGETFRDCEVELDGKTFIDCLFENVVFKYKGGSARFRGCQFGTFNLLLDGDLAQGLEFVRMLAHAAGPKQVKRTVDFFTTFMRKSDAPQTFTIG